MLPYERIASALNEISQAPRAQKAKLAASLLAGLPNEALCQVVRLITGDLWPSWEPLEMGIGPEAITAALEEISREDITALRSDMGEMGAVAKAALQHKVQHPLSAEPLDALAVYNTLRHISMLDGLESEHRKVATLRGLLLYATPLEGEYIAKTAMRNICIGLGPQKMTAAISLAFGLDEDEVRMAYSLMPDLGMLAVAAMQNRLSSIAIQPSRPVRSMRIQSAISSKAAILPDAYLPVYPGMMVQVHRAGGRIYVYSFRLKNITAALQGLEKELSDQKHDVVLDARLIGFQDDRAISQADVVRYINRRHFARRSRLTPALAVYDMLYLDGANLTGLAYEERRRRLIGILGEPKEHPFKGISSVEERIIRDPEEMKNYLCQVQKEGCKGLMARDLKAPYIPGSSSRRDFMIK